MRFAVCLLAFGLCAGTQSPPSLAELSEEAGAALRGDPARAADLYEQALRLKPAWAEGWFNLGAARFQLQRFRESKQAFARAAELDPKHGTIWGFLALAEARMHEDGEARTHCRQGETLGLADDRAFVATVRTECASLALAAGDFSAAVTDLEPLAEMGDPPPRAVELLGRSVLGVKTTASDGALVHEAGTAAWSLYGHHTDKALALTAKLAAEHPDTPHVHYLRGVTLLGEDNTGADAEFRRELEINPTDIPARIQLAISALRANRPEAALPLAREAAAREPGNPLARTVLGRALLDGRQTAAALPEFVAAERLAPEHPQIHFYLEKTYRLLGREAEAQREKAEYFRLNAAQKAELPR